MKLLIILLFTLNVYADVKVDIVNLEGRVFGGKFALQSEADNWISEKISKNSWGKKERWETYTDQTTCITTEDIMKSIRDPSEVLPNPLPRSYAYQMISVLDYTRCRMPAQYTVVTSDITKQENERRTKETTNKERLASLKAAIKNRPMTLREITDYIKIKEGI